MGPKSALGRSIRVGVSALRTSWIDIIKILTTEKKTRRSCSHGPVGRPAPRPSLRKTGHRSAKPDGLVRGEPVATTPKKSFLVIGLGQILFENPFNFLNCLRIVLRLVA